MKDLINKLIIDQPFGIYTRNGLEYTLKDIKNKLHIYLLDFNDVKSLNEKHGYKSVNEIFKKTFSELNDKFIIGRAFSGDEIFICTTNEDAEIWAINYIEEICSKNNLYFEHIYSIFDPFEEDIKDKFDKMIEQLHG